MIKLCYKEYDWKISNAACRSFKERVGKDLMGFFSAYIVASINLKKGISLFERTEILRDLASEKDACIALHCIISAAQDSIPLEELEDGAARVSWTISDRPDDLSEPWPVVMLNVAFEINAYINDNLPKKKEAT